MVEPEKIDDATLDTMEAQHLGGDPLDPNQAADLLSCVRAFQAENGDLGKSQADLLAVLGCIRMKAERFKKEPDDPAEFVEAVLRMCGAGTDEFYPPYKDGAA